MPKYVYTPNCRKYSPLFVLFAFEFVHMLGGCWTSPSLGRVLVINDLKGSSLYLFLVIIHLLTGGETPEGLDTLIMQFPAVVAKAVGERISSAAVTCILPVKIQERATEKLGGLHIYGRSVQCRRFFGSVFWVR